MELTHAENQVVAQAPAKRRWRVQFSLGTLIWMTITAGALALFGLSYRETLALREGNRALRDHLGLLTIGDSQKIHVVAAKTEDELTWRWRVHLPPGRKFRLDSRLLNIPPANMPSKAGYWGDTAGGTVCPNGQFLVEAGIRRTADGALFPSLLVNFDPYGPNRDEAWPETSLKFRTLGSCTPRKEQWLTEVNFHYDQLGWNGTKTMDSTPVVLLRLRKGEQTSDQPCPGLMVWIEEDKPAEGTKP
jgi:hypothetical protein